MFSRMRTNKSNDDGSPVFLSQNFLHKISLSVSFRLHLFDSLNERNFQDILGAVAFKNKRRRHFSVDEKKGKDS